MAGGINEHGIIIETETVLNYKDDKIEYSIKKGIFEGKEYFESRIAINGYGVICGASGPCSIYSKDTYQDEVDYIKHYLERELGNSPEGLNHIKKLEIFQEVKQLSLW